MIEALVQEDSTALILLSRAHIERPMRSYIAQYKLKEITD